MDNTEKFINHLSCCSGYGGIGRGLKQVLPNVREIAHVEIEAYAIANLCEKMEKGLLVPAPIWSDLKTFNFSAFRESLKYGILSAGFPCQPFSQAGQKKSTKDPRHLWPYIIEGIRQCNPMFSFLENVQGIITAKTADGESVLKYVCGELEQQGYKVATGIFSASEVGAPHQRKRVFILGYSNRSRQQQQKGINEKIRGRSKHASKKMADTSSKGLQGSQLNKAYNRTDCEQARPHGSVTKRSFSKWPTRPGEKQHDWEEPRIVEYAKSPNGNASRLQMRKEKKLASPRKQCENENEFTTVRNCNQRATPKPELGRATYGPSSGVDANNNRIERLTLCGNGVVPQTAALAFVTLLKKLEKMNVENNSDV